MILLLLCTQYIRYIFALSNNIKPKSHENKTLHNRSRNQPLGCYNCSNDYNISLFCKLLTPETMLNTIKRLYRLQTSSLVTFQQKYGHYTGTHFYSVLHGKAKGNVINLCLHLSTAELITLFSDQERKKNVKLIHTIKTK